MITIESTDDVRIAVHELGGDGPPLLFAHATGFHGHVWRAVAAEFPDRRCLALDFRGYGDSTLQTGALTWHGFSDDVLAVVAALDLRGVDAVGHSKGAAALLLAEQAEPGTFGRIAAYEPIVFPPLDENPLPGMPGVDANGNNPMAEGARRRRATFDSFEEAIARFGAKPPLGTLRADVLDDYVRFGFRATEDGTVTLKASPEHEAQTYETGASHGAFAHLDAVRCPVLVASGGEDFGPALFAPRVAAALPHATAHRFGDLGHFGPLQDPVAFAAVLRDFLAPA